MFVMKFGGTSTQDASAMANVAQIVKSHLQRTPVVVISAIANATNILESAGKLAASENDQQGMQLLSDLFDRHYAILDKLIHNNSRYEELHEIFDKSFSELEILMKGIAILREITPRTLDMLYCYGELLSSRLVAAVLQEIGVDAVWIDSKDFMITDENFNRALPRMDKVEIQLNHIAKPLLQQKKVIVTQGFIGVTESGFRTTMGRESSDFSAAIIGAVLGAEGIQIWTDVDGILTADPMIVKNSHVVKMMTFEEAYELSFFGAKVLHPNTILPAHTKNIPIYIYNSRKPHQSGTVISPNKVIDRSEAKSIAYKSNISVLNISPRNRLGQYIFWQEIYNVLTKYGAVAYLVAASNYNVSITLDSKIANTALIRDLNDIGSVEILEKKGIVTVVGSNIHSSPKILNDIFHALEGFSISLFSFGPSGASVSFVVDDDVVPKAVCSIHKELFERN